MPLLPATLNTELDTQVVNVAVEATAVDAWALAWKNYFAGAISNAVPITVPALATAETLMRAAMVGLGTNGQAAVAAGITAWWGALVASPAVYFTGATLITPPPGIGTIAANLTPVFAANTTGSLTKTAAMAAIGTVLHTANVGGTATFPGPIVAPIT